MLRSWPTGPGFVPDMRCEENKLRIYLGTAQKLFFTSSQCMNHRLMDARPNAQYNTSRFLQLEHKRKMKNKSLRGLAT